MPALFAIACCLLLQEPAPDKRRLTSAPDRRVELDFQHYYKTRELHNALSSLAAAYPEFVQLTSLGKSRSNEDLWLLTLSENGGVDPRSKPAIFVSASQGLGDLQGSELALSSVVEFLQNNKREERVGRALRETTAYFVLCANPDLRTSVLTEVETGTAASTSAQSRIDLDRNYPVGWNPFQVGDDPLPRNPGPYPLSEPESRWISTFLVEHENIAAVVGFAPSNWASTESGLEPALVREPASLQQLLDSQGANAGAALEFSGRAGDPRGTIDDFAYGQLGALPLRLLCGEIDVANGLALPRTDEIAPLARKVAASLLSLSEALPRLSISGTSVQRLKNDLWQIEVTIANSGSLRTQSVLGSARRSVGLPRLAVKGGKLAVACVRIGQDQVYVPMPIDEGRFALTELDGGAQLRVRVLVEAGAETSLDLTVSSPRAGSATASLVLR
ncbi:MAG: M14 family zinc carboxypeptidase [Planctomycetota bacterium]